MHDIFETLEQTVMWYGQDDFPYRIDEMEQSHRFNVKNFLERRAYHLHARYIWRESRDMDRAPFEVQAAWMRENERTLMGTPEDWLANRPFMKALEQAIKNHGTIDGEVVDSHIVDEKALVNVGSAVERYSYRMKASATGRLVPVPNPPMQSITSAQKPELKVASFECYKRHDGCTSKEKCEENSFRDWETSHDTTECGGMQNGCQLCAHIW